MSRRPAHKLAHAPCPYLAANWADCDAAAAHRWGQCSAMVESKGEPHTCTHWAVTEYGLCGQHYVAAHDKAMNVARMAERTLQLNESIDAFLAQDGSAWWERLAPSSASTRGLAGVDAPPMPPPPPLRVPRRPFRVG